MAYLDCEMKIDIPSNKGFVSGTLLGIKSFIIARSEMDFTDLLVVLRELLNNAIVHGNGNRLDRKVKLIVRDLGEERYALDIEDEGEGFDYRTLKMEAPEDPRLLTTRGYVLVKALSEEIRFNEKGNRIFTVIKLKKKRSQVWQTSVE